MNEWLELFNETSFQSTYTCTLDVEILLIRVISN
jgi:hypothetical protein